MRSVKSRDHRPNAHQRGYTRQWESASAEFLRRNPFCLGCMAMGKPHIPATVVDHVIPHRGDQQKFWNVLNWQPSCDWHHRAIKPMLEREHAAGRLTSAELVLCSATARKLSERRYRPAIGADGFPIRGY